MRKSTILAGAFVLLGTVLPGCLNAADPVASVTDPLGGAPSTANAFLPDFHLALQGCDEAGGVSLYNMQEGSTGPVEPFQQTNIQDDVGNPIIASYGQPIPPGGATTGIWHISTICKSYTFNGRTGENLRWGWVAVRILPPPWDDSGIKRQYFVADLSFGDPEIVKTLQNEGGVHASRLLEGKIEWVAPMVLHTILDDEDHGVFDTWAKMRDYRPMEPGPVRFWMLIAASGGHMHHDEGASMGMVYRPISFDLVNAGDDARHLVVDGTGWLSHTRTDAHGQVPGAAGNLGGLLWTGFDRTLQAGPSPEGLMLAKTWRH